MGRVKYIEKHNEGLRTSEGGITHEQLLAHPSFNQNVFLNIQLFSGISS